MTLYKEQWIKLLAMADDIRAFIKEHDAELKSETQRLDRDATATRAMNDASAFIGYWKITEMEVWGPAYIDLVVPGFIEFQHEERHLMGTFQFGTVSGWLDCRLRDVGGEDVVEWSWQGQSDTDPGCGRGWATLVNGELVGRIFIHCGDDSAFRATRQTRPITRRGVRTSKERTERTMSRLQ